jgi:hypothetical protein
VSVSRRCSDNNSAIAIEAVETELIGELRQIRIGVSLWQAPTMSAIWSNFQVDFQSCSVTLWAEARRNNGRLGTLRIAAKSKTLGPRY